MTDEKAVTLSVAYHAFNADQTQLAVAPNTNEVHIYDSKGEDAKNWTLKYVLKEHSGLVCGLDWCHQTNLLVSCGQDRNAYVWRHDAKTNEWKPTLVILRINRAATSVKWSPLGNKFAVTSGAKCVPVCHFEQSNDWWISKMIKKHKSTVTSLAWCPNNKFIVTGSCDMKTRVFSAYIAGLDAEQDDGFGEVWADQHKFGEVLLELENAKAWVNTVAWSPSGFRLAFAGHGSTMHFVQILAGSAPLVQTLNVPCLPFLDIAFANDNNVLAVGYDRNPTLFTASGSDAEPVFALREYLDKDKKKGGAAPAPAAAGAAGFGGARAKFAGAVDRGISSSSGGAESKAEEIWTRHKNTITNMWFIPGSENMRLTTSGLDGRVLFWDLKKIGITL